MAHSPEIKTEAFELYLLGNAADEISRELKRRHPDTADKMPSAKTIEKWAYSGSPTWSEKRHQAEAEAQASVTKDFVSQRSKMMVGMLKLQEKLQDRALTQAEDAEPGNFQQEIYAFINATKAAASMLDDKLAEEARRKDAIDCLIEAVRRVVPSFEQLQPKIMAEFQRLVAGKTTATA